MRVVIIEDEKISLQLLEGYLKKIDYVDVVGGFDQPIAGREFVLENDVDVVFLDIHMPEVTGIELATEITELKPEVIIVFLTAYDKFAVDAFELNALDYILKPITEERLHISLERIGEQMRKRKEKVQDSTLTIQLSDDLVFEKAGQVEKVEWRTVRGKGLFLYLLINQGSAVSKDRLMELLWSDYEQERGYSLLYTTIYSVRKLLSNYDPHFKIMLSKHGYMLKMTDVVLEAEEWQTKLKALPPLTNDTIELYEEQLDKNKVPYLQHCDFIWLEPQRFRLEQRWLKLAMEIAAFYEENEEKVKAIQLYTKICQRCPDAEAAYFSLMKIYAELKDYVLVNRHYDLLVEALDENLGIEPSDEIKEWYEKVIGERALTLD